MHGFEGWHLSTAILKKLNGFGIRAQSRIKGWDHDVVAHQREHFHLVLYIRLRRFEFLGKTLLLPLEELAHQPTRPS